MPIRKAVLVVLIVAVAGCGASAYAPIKMRNPRSGEIASCGPQYGAIRDGLNYRLMRDCVEDYQRQGWERGCPSRDVERATE
jgi:hypothetical protein